MCGTPRSILKEHLPKESVQSNPRVRISAGLGLEHRLCFEDNLYLLAVLTEPRGAPCLPAAGYDRLLGAWGADLQHP